MYSITIPHKTDNIKRDGKEWSATQDYGENGQKY